jgi:ATP/maltotriose-dependent transcriptional regulator MalT
MSTPQVRRHNEGEAISKFLTLCSANPAGLLFAVEAGIGKTTLWMAAVEQARERGMHVLTARTAATESVMAYISLADLLSGAEPGVLYELPEPQRLAVDRVLLQVGETDVATDQRAVAAAFLSVVEILAEDAPVLLAIDDLQWLDPSSALAIGYAARRFAGSVGVLGTVRAGDGIVDLSWLQLPPPDTIQRIDLRPLSIGGLQQVLTARLGRTPSRRTMVRIHEASGGNPFYAIELARAAAEGDSDGEFILPDTLSDLVAAKVSGLDSAAREALLATACLATPTVDVVSQAIGATPEHCAQRLEVAATRGIIAFDDDRVRFTHPLLAHGVYGAASPPQRRLMHRRLAELLSEPELHARHLALSDPTGEPQTLEALDTAARMARWRGAPLAAAEFLDLAIGLGGDSPKLWIRSARNHLDAGDSSRAQALLREILARLPPGALRAEALNTLAVVNLYCDSFVEAADLLARALDEVGDHLPLRVQTLVTLSFTLLNLGDIEAGLAAGEQALAQAERLGHPALLSQALSLRAHLWFRRGHGLDRVSMQRALQLEDRDMHMPAALRPSVQNALLLGWTGEFGQAYDDMAVWRRRCTERGEDNELVHVLFNMFQIEVWRGNFAEATQLAEDALESARQVGGDLALGAALTMHAFVAAYTGDEGRARENAAAAYAASQRCGAEVLGRWPVECLGFLEVSLGDYGAALTTLAPLLSAVEASPSATEISVAGFVPDAVEALIGVGRPDDAVPLVDALERNGARLDRPWMLATGARSRAMLLAARGDLKAAVVAVEAAMAEHERLPMPFERARTQLIVGELQRRQRGRENAAATLRSAEASFTALGIPLWARRARTSLERIRLGSSDSGVLTSAEKRVAELAAQGKTNHDIASTLFISPKTVEVHLSRIYRKLDIRSRAELGRRLDRLANSIDPDVSSI